MSKPLTIGLFGFGCVGQGLWNILQQQHHSAISIKKICVKNPGKPRPLPETCFTFNPDDILLDDEIDVVVELIDDAATAFTILKTALSKGKHVVTANKKMLAENLAEVVNLQRQHNRTVLYEAAVCGSIPIIRTLEDYYAHQKISSIEGIFNGTTNYILTRVLEDKLTYSQALTEAQQAGFAEANPTLDVEGLDARNKLSIAILHAFGLLLPAGQITVAGISRIGLEEAEYARQHQLSIKLLAKATLTDSGVYAYVLPQFIPQSSPLAAVRHEFNAVSISGNFAGQQLLIGKGAGSLPTALAVWADLNALPHHYRYHYRKAVFTDEADISTRLSVHAWVRFADSPYKVWELFSKITGGNANHSGQVVVGEITLGNLNRLLQLHQASVVLLPEDGKINALPTAVPAGALQQVA
jgi:homoserine dehydrogenase